MLYYLSQKLLEWTKGTPWADHLSALRLFRYITVRSAGAAVTALLLSWWLGPKIIRWLKQLKFGQDYADKAEEAGGLAARVLSKKGTPTMGGVLIVTVLVFSTVLVDGDGQQAGVADAAVGAGAGGAGILRRLRENHPAKRRRHAAAGETDRANRRWRCSSGFISGCRTATSLSEAKLCHPES